MMHKTKGKPQMNKNSTIIPVSDKSQIKVERTTFKGSEIISINKMYCTDSNPEFKHGKGLGIKVEHANAVARAIEVLMGDE